MEEDAKERRQFPRINAPVYCRPAGWLETRSRMLDIGLGGARIYSDVEVQLGAKLSLDLFLPDGRCVNCLAKVAWTANLGDEGPSPWEVGLKFIDVREEDMALLLGLLRADDAADEASSEGE